MRKPPALAFLFLVVSPLVLRAQSTNASLTGRITDSTKAVIADAKIAAISTETNVRYEATTNGSGEYHLSNLPPSTYRLEVEKSGFKKTIKPNVILHVQDALEINFEMTVGSVNETVTVEGGAPLVNTESATVSTVIDRMLVADLPLNGRSFQTLVLLTPGVVPTATNFKDQGQFSVNGQRADGNYFSVDGVSANFGVTGYFPMMQSGSGALPAFSASGGTNSLVSVDALQEFRVQTSSFAPEFGRTPGGQISIVTRSGTNSFHGTLFEYFRNDKLDANDWFANANRVPKPAERQNDFGGVFGGPIFKDKTFFFFSYEGLRLRLPSTEETIVPCDSSCLVFGDARAMAPATSQPFLNAYSLPNGSELFNPCAPAGVNGCPASGQKPTGLAQFNASFSNPSSLDAYSIRLDHIINSKFTLFGRYNYAPSNVAARGPFAAPMTVLSSVEPLDSSVQTVTLGLTESITPGISNEIRANYSNDRLATKYFVDNFGGAVPLPDSLLFPSGFTSANSGFEFFVVGAGVYELGKQATDEQRQINLLDNFSVAKGRHQMKFGVDYRWLAPFSSPSSYFQFGEFNGIGTNPGQALSGIALFAAVHNIETNALLAQNFSFYGQDTWKLTPRLTVTYGLRWEIDPAIKGKNSANDPFTVTNLDNPAAIALAPRGTPLYNTTYGNFAPRVGVAYQLRQSVNSQTVLRAGFGTFYDLGQGTLGGVSSYFPYHATKGLSLVPFPLSAANAMQPALTTTIPPPVNTMLVADPHLKLPRTYQWNVAFEQSIGSAQSLSFTYIGAAGRDLLRATNIAPNPNFLFLSVTTNSARSYYNALQIKFQRRLSKGLQGVASYTFSHSIDNASTDEQTYTNTPGGGNYQSTDRGNSDFDIRHSFTAGFTYDLPTLGSQKFVRSAFGGWSVDTFLLARSAPPVNLVGSILFNAGYQLSSRPNVNPGVPLELFGSQYPGGKIFNKAAFSPPPKGQQGDFGRNILRGFGATQADIGLQKQFHFTENLALRFRTEFFNILNHPNFGPPNNSLAGCPLACSPLFGFSTSTLATSLGTGGANGGFSPLYQIGGPRSIQLALKLLF